MKKLLSLLMAVILTVSVGCAIPVLAAEDTTEAVTVLKAFEILIGDEVGNLNLDKPITRAEFSTILLRVLEVNEAYGAEVDFIDVPKTHWAYNAIANAYNLKIINGYGDGTFKPENNVSYEEAVKMTMCVLGYEPYAVSKGGYPAGYLIAANQAKVTVGVGTKATRGDIAQLIFNALSTPKMEQTSYGSETEFSILDGKSNRDYKTLLTEKDIYIASGIVGTKDIEEDTVVFETKENSKDLKFKEKKLEIFDINNSNIANYENEYVEAYVLEYKKNNYKTIVVIPSNMGNSITIISDDIKEIKDNKIEYYIHDSKTKTIKLDEKCSYFLNKNICTFDDLIVDDIELTLIENTGDNEYDMITGVKYADARVIDIDDDRLKLNKKWIEFDFDSDVEYIFVDAKGNTIDFKDFEEDDVVAIVADNTNYNDAKYLKLIKLTDNVITGAVTEISTQKDKNYVWINNDKYEDTTKSLKNEDEGTFYISMTGKIFDFEGTSSADNYAYILEAAKNTNATFASDIWEIKVLTKNGVKEYSLTEDASVDYENDLKDIGLFKNNKNNYDNRIITFKTNSKGYIRNINFITFKTTELDEYNSKTQKLNGNIIEDDTIIFDVTAAKAESTFSTNIDYLVDDGEYKGLIVKEDNEVELLVIIESKAKVSDETGFAIVTEVKNKSVDGEEIVVIDYIQDMEEGIITFNEDAESMIDNGFTLDDINIGSVFIFNSENQYLILGTINEKGYLAIDENALSEFSEDNEFVYGYIASEDGGKSSKYETIVVGGVNTEDLSVGADTNTYSYYNTKRNIEIKTSYITEDADWYKFGTAEDGSEDEATIFFARIVDGSLIDIYTFNNRVVGKEAIDAIQGFLK